MVIHLGSDVGPTVGCAAQRHGTKLIRMTIVGKVPEHAEKSCGTEPVDAGSVQFHRVRRVASTYRWWKPILVGAATVVCWAALTTLLSVLLGLGAGLFPGVEQAMDTFLQSPDDLNLSDPFSFAVGMVTIILMLPALWLATTLLGTKPVGLLSSVVGKVRWGWCARCSAVATSLYVVGYSGSFAVASSQGESLAPTLDTPQTLVLLALTAALVPLQSAAEEYVFRGYLMQSIGGWLAHPAFAILLPVPFFVIGHDYGVLGMLDVAVFAAVAGWLTWRTGGLEAAIALHAAGNASGLSLVALGLADVSATELGVSDLLLSLTVTFTFAALVLRLAGRHNVQRTLKRVPQAPAEAR